MMHAQNRLHVVDGVVLPLLVSRDLTVAAVDKIETSSRMQSIVVRIDAVLLEGFKPTQWNPLVQSAVNCKCTSSTV